MKKEYTIIEFLNRKVRIQKENKLNLTTALKNKSKNLPKSEKIQESSNLFEWLHQMFMHH